jgi:hypothetical protein
MPDTNPTATTTLLSFLLLPAELRIAIYHALLSSSPFTTPTSPLLRGALLSSSQLSCELTYEMPSFFFANLSSTIASIQTTWNATFPLSPLLITLPAPGTLMQDACVGD